MNFNIDEMQDNILHAIAVAKEKHTVKEDFSIHGDLPTNEEEYKENIRWLNGEDEDGNQLYHADQKLTWKQVQDVVVEASARNKLYDLRKERTVRLTETDWTSNSDIVMSDEMKKYRQNLRDITKTATSLDDVKWPTKPE